MKKHIKKIQSKKSKAVLIKVFGITTALIFSILNATSLAFAKKIIIPETDLPGPSEYTQATDLSTYFNENVFGNITQTVIGLTALAAFLFTIISGVRMVTAYGTEDDYGAAKKMFMISLVGLLLAMLSYTIVSIISNLQF